MAKKERRKREVAKYVKRERGRNNQTAVTVTDSASFFRSES